MVALFDAAQVERIVGLVADQEPEAIHVECARTAEIAHAELDMACAHDVERRVEDRLVDRHGTVAVDGSSAPTSNTSRGRRKPASAAGAGERRCGLQVIICAAGRASARSSATASSICASRLSRFTTLLECSGRNALDQAKAAAAGVRPDVPLAEVELMPPLPAPEKILCIGINYANREHDYDFAEPPKYPSMFYRAPNSVVGNGRSSSGRKSPSSSTMRARSRS